MPANAKTLTTLALAAIMLVPTLLAAIPGAAADNVPTLPGTSAPVEWTPLAGFNQTLWLQYQDAGAQPDCTKAGILTPSGPGAPVTPGGTRAQCPYGTGAASQAGGSDSAVFSYGGAFVRDWNMTGQSILAHVSGSFQPSQVLTVTVSAGSMSLTGTHTTGASTSPTTTSSFDVALGPSGADTRVAFAKGSTFKVTISSSVTQVPVPGGLPGGAATPSQFSIDDTQSYVTIASDDAYRAATWTGDANASVINTFRPMDNNSTSSALLKGFFAMQSAWGSDDLGGVSAPTFRVFQDDHPFQPFPGAITQTGGSPVTSLSRPDQGIVTWGFPQGALDYRGWPSAALRLEVSTTYFGQANAHVSQGTSHPFAINAQGVRLAAFEDDTTTPHLVESVSHSAPSGGATTFLLTANNTGGAPDSFKVQVAFVPVAGSPQTGWSATLGGPQLVGDTVSLDPGESKILTLTVGMPFASAGSGTFRVTASSVSDPALASEPVILIASIGAPQGHDVGVIAPHDITMDAGRDVDVPLYVWNRGGTPANATLSLASSDSGGWTTGLLSNALTLRSLQVSNVPAGGIAVATLRVHGPDQSQTQQLDVTLNVTNKDVAGIAMDRVLRLHLTTVGGFRVQVLDKINGLPVGAEVDPCSRTAAPPTPPDTNCLQQNAPGASFIQEDGVDGILLRAWITNTGRVTEDAKVSLDPKPVFPGCADGVFDHTVNDAGFRLKTRSADGALQDFDGNLLGVKPGETYEAYVFIAVNRDQGTCGSNDIMQFTLGAVGAKTGAIGQYTAQVRATDGEDSTNVLLQPVVRAGSTTNPSVPLVDLSNAEKTVVTQGVGVGKNATFYVRMVNGASWGSYNDSNGHLVPATAALTIINPRAPDGWNVSVRPVTSVVDQAANPFRASYELGNVDPTTQGADGLRRLALNDVELQVNVTAPDGKNHTALANDQDQITLEATMGTSRSTLSITAVIGDQAAVNLHAEPRVLAHPVDGGATAIYVYNNGSAPTTVTLAAAIDRDATPNPDGWNVQPAAQTFTLAAFHNRTVALSITPPAGSSGGRVHVTASYVEFRATGQVNVTSVDVPVDVVPSGALSLDTPVRAATTGPGQPAQFTLTISNKANSPVNYRLAATEIPNWTATISPAQGVVPPQGSVTVPFVLQAPSDAINATAYQTVVTAQDTDQPEDFATLPVTVNVQGGQAIPSLSALTFQKTVDRASSRVFEVQVRNLGNANGTMPLSVRTAEPGWGALLQSTSGQNITSVTLGPNELATVDVVVFAPLAVPENKAVNFEVTASTQDATQSSNAAIRALIHDYGVKAEVPASAIDIVPGIAQDVLVRVTNTGNDNDTLNLSVILPTTDFQDWTATVSPDHVLLAPGETADVHASLRPPVSPLPSPRAYAFTLYAGSVGGAAVNVPKNATVAATANVLNYRALDVDGDGQVELAIDQDKSSANGFEQFREISGDGVQCVVASSSRLNGLARFFLDCPLDGRSLDGVADVWFDPESVYAYKIAQVADVNGDGTPEYMVDSDRDGKIDLTFDTVTEKYWNTTEVHALGGGAVQYLVDTNADGRPDYYVDTSAHLATKTLPVEGHDDLVGIDTKNAGSADKYYDPATQSVTGASVANLSDFASTNWYFIVGFVALVVLTVVLIVVRARGRKPKE